MSILHITEPKQYIYVLIIYVHSSLIEGHTRLLFLKVFHVIKEKFAPKRNENIFLYFFALASNNS